MRKTWRLQGGSDSLIIMRRSDLGKDEKTSVSSLFPTARLDRWLSDPHSRKSILDMYESVGGYSIRSGRASRQVIARYVKPRLEKAFQRGDLVVLRVAAQPLHAAGTAAHPINPSSTDQAINPPSSRGRLVRASDNKGEEEIYVVAAAVKTIGDTPLVNHKVRILDPDTGKTVVDSLTTDDKGVVRATVPENKKYRIEILDEEREAPPLPPPQPDDPQGILICHFVDEYGIAVSNERVEAASGDDRFDLVTDENGRIEVPTRLAAFDLTIRGETFMAHSLLWKDLEEGDKLYRFILAPEDSQEEGGEEKVRLTNYSHFDADEGAAA
jgi:hypothetical protein